MRHLKSCKWVVLLLITQWIPKNIYIHINLEINLFDLSFFVFLPELVFGQYPSLCSLWRGTFLREKSEVAAETRAWGGEGLSWAELIWFKCLSSRQMLGHIPLTLFFGHHSREMKNTHFAPTFGRFQLTHPSPQSPECLLPIWAASGLLVPFPTSLLTISEP